MAAHTAAGSRSTSAGAARRAVASPDTVRTTTSTAATATPQPAMTSVASQPPPSEPQPHQRPGHERGPRRVALHVDRVVRRPGGEGAEERPGGRGSSPRRRGTRTASTGAVSRRPTVGRGQCHRPHDRSAPPAGGTQRHGRRADRRDPRPRASRPRSAGSRNGPSRGATPSDPRTAPRRGRGAAARSTCAPDREARATNATSPTHDATSGPSSTGDRTPDARPGGPSGPQCFALRNTPAWPPAGTMGPWRTSGSTVVLPALDEALALPGVLAGLPAGYLALVVDNGSSDGTGRWPARSAPSWSPSPDAGFGAACAAGPGRRHHSRSWPSATATARSTSATCPSFAIPCSPAMPGWSSAPGSPPRRGAWPLHARLANRVPRPSPAPRPSAPALRPRADAGRPS